MRTGNRISQEFPLLFPKQIAGLSPPRRWMPDQTEPFLLEESKPQTSHLKGKLNFSYILENISMFLGLETLRGDYLRISLTS